MKWCFQPSTRSGRGINIVQQPAPRLDIDLEKFAHNALALVTRLRAKGISVTGVAKVLLGSPEISKAWDRVDICELADIREGNTPKRLPATICAALRCPNILFMGTVAIGRQDIAPDVLEPPAGLKILSASSDHLAIDAYNSREPMKVGSQISFYLDYSTSLRAMTSPFYLQHDEDAPNRKPFRKSINFTFCMPIIEGFHLRHFTFL